LLSFLVLIGGSITAAAASTPNALSFPILIVGASGTGSGFCINANNAVYLVTAKHVLLNPNTGKLNDKEIKLIVHPGDENSDAIPLSLDVPILDSTGKIKAHPSADVAVIRLFDICDEPRRR
jgi:S1-C subfamily serine protease